MGLTNYAFTSVDQITDVEVRGYYQEFLDKGMTPEKAFAKVLAGTREHARIPLPWNETCLECHKGLTQEINENMRHIYKKLIGIRKQEKALIYGDFNLLSRKKDRFVFERTLGADSFIIDCNLGNKVQNIYKVPRGYKAIFGVGAKETKLAPYGAVIWKRK